MHWRVLGLIGAIAALAGCVSSPQAGPPVSESADYPAGYSDGCASAGGRGAQIPERTISRSEQSEGYRAGWKAGYGACGGDFRDDPLHHR